MCRAIQAFSLIIALIVPAVVCAEDQDLIDYRHIMKTLEAEVASIQLILHQKAPADSLATHVKLLGIAAGIVKSAFKLKLPSLHAQPEIWALYRVPEVPKQ